MYAFRKAFAVGVFADLSFLGIDYKIWLITAQVIGYMLSKFIGIKVIAEMGHKNRGVGIVILVGIAGLALLGFALVPIPYNIIFLFLNGLPLGMVFGLVFSYLEGRKTTELLGVGLCASFIFAAGFVKTMGKWVLQNWGIGEFWMPLAVAGICAGPLVFFVWLLEQLPPPSESDIQLRTKREPMLAKSRWKFSYEFGLGLVLLVSAYVLLTAYRDFRDNFAPEIWQALGYGNSSDIFAYTETPVAVFILIIISLLFLIKDNFIALMTYHFLIFTGFLLVGLSTWAFESQLISPVLWMILLGIGLYLGYVPFNSLMFDRLLGAFRYVGNVGFIMYLSDSFGYLGSVAVLFYKNFGQVNLSWLDFFIAASYLMAFGGTFLTLLAGIYFWIKYKGRTEMSN